jgi:dTDP-4-amino-4,6-dideoxy-D-galactose acyltransferase
MDLIERLPWDTEHFGVSVARVCRPADGDGVRSAAEAADAAGVECLTALIDADDVGAIAVAEEIGFRSYDVRIELDRRLAPDPSDVAGVRPADGSDVARLEAIARERFGQSRFYADPGFGRDRAAALYVAWLERGMSSDSRRTLVTDAADGFVVCRLDAERAVGSIELIGVAEESERRGLGLRLVRGAHSLFAAAGLLSAEVVTQGRNLPAQRLYQREGYRTRRVAVWLHRWALNR